MNSADKGGTALRGLTLAQGALTKARALGCKPMTIAVVNAGGVLLVLKREDGSANLRPDIAYAKAWGAVGMGIGGRAMAKRAKEMPEFWAALNAISSGRIAPVAGGVLVLQDERVVGSVGVSGDVSDHDEACSLAGVEAAGLGSDVGENSLGKQ